MAYYFADTAPIIRTHYLSLRTRRSLDWEDDCFKQLAKVVPFEIDVMGLGRGAWIWEDGCVFKLRNKLAALDMANALRPGLELFESWAVHDASGSFIEYPSGGPMSRFFDLDYDAKTRGAFSRIFVMRGENDKLYEQTVSRLRNEMRAPCLPVFHFRDGQIMMLQSDESARITSQRSPQQFSRLQGWAIIDSAEATESNTNPRKGLWERQLLSEFENCQV